VREENQNLRKYMDCNAKKVVVTGAGGFIGERLCSSLRERNYRVAGVYLSPKASFVDEYRIGDISRDGDWCEIFRGAEVVFHLAGKAHAVSEVREDGAEYFRINTEGTKRVLTAAMRFGVKRLVFFSSVKAMSRDDLCVVSEPQSEDHFIEPDTPYGQSKLAAEELVLHGGFVPEPVVLRPCMVYGPGAKGNIYNLIEAHRRHLVPPLPEFGNRRSMVHVADVVRAAILSSEHSAAVRELFIVSDGCAYSTREVCFLIRRALGLKESRVSVPIWALRVLAQLGDSIGYLCGRRFVFDSNALAKLSGTAWFSSSKIERMIGFHPEWSLERGLTEMVASMGGSRRR